MDSPNTLECTRENFAAAVLENSHRVPVVVDFWAPWCAPCRALLPLLSTLALEYGGEFILAKVNIDEQPELATQFGVRSVPTVKLVRGGAVIDEFLGALPESAVREFIDRHIEREADRAIAAAVEMVNAGHTGEAATLLDDLLRREPANAKAILARAELCVAAREHARAHELLARLPASASEEPAVKRIAAQIQFALAADSAPAQATLEARIAADASDSEARYQLAMVKAAQGDSAAAVEQLLELLRRDRAYGDDAARKGLLALFELLGDGELVNRYRRLMFNALH